MSEHIFTIAGIQLTHTISVSLPTLYSFHGFVQETIRGGTSFNGQAREPLKERLRFTLGPEDYEQLWTESWPERAELVRHNANALLSSTSGFEDPRSTLVLRVQEGIYQPSWDAGWIVSALRLFCPGDIQLGPSPQWRGPSAMACKNAPSNRDAGLSRKQTDSLVPFFHGFSDVMDMFRVHPSLAIAQRHLSRAMFRQLSMGHASHPGQEFQAGYLPLEDVVLHLTVALDALFSLGDPAGRGHKERIARRVSKFWAKANDFPVPVQDLIRWAFDVRGSVVHGRFAEFPKAAKYGSIRGRAGGSPQSTTACLRHLVRVSLLAVASVLKAGISVEDLRDALDDSIGTSSTTLSRIRTERRAIRRLSYELDVAVTGRLTWVRPPESN